MKTNDEINKPSLKEKLYQETLDEFARKQFSPIDRGIGSWEDLKEVYVKYSEAKENWKPYFNDIEKAINLAIDKTYDEARSEALADFCKELDKKGLYRASDEVMGDSELLNTGDIYLTKEDYLALKRKHGIKE